MLREDAIKLANKLRKTREKHKDYDRVVKLADDYMALITGEGIDRMLFQFVQREDATMFEQRVKFTQATTPAIASSIMKPFYKVSRNDKVKIRIDFKDPEKNKAIQDMLMRFYGAKRSKNKGLRHWLSTRFVELTFTDPNAWVVNQWDKPLPDKTPEPKPFEITARQAFNFSMINGELYWLFACLEDTYTVQDNDYGSKQVPGEKLVLYDQDFTIVTRIVDKDGLALEGWVETPDEYIFEESGKWYMQSIYEPKIGFVAAFRVGYDRDAFTLGRTCVNPFHPAMAFFKKSIKTVSELDLTMMLHVFPQKIQYVQKCMGESKVKTCHGGYVNGTADKCTACAGKGYKIHTTAQDAILLPMPEDKEDMIDLEKVLVYKTPPIELIRFMDEYTKSLKHEAHLAVFNSQIFTNPTVAKTATEIDDNMQSIYDTLEPFTEKVSEVHKEEVYIFAHLVAVSEPDNSDNENVHQYPGDLKLKTTTILLNELKLVNDSGAPSFMRDAIGNDLAEIIYVGDEIGLLKYTTKHRFFPFNGKGPDEIAMLMASEHVSNFTKVLYSNFEAIFKDIELENPSFWLMKSYAKQWTIVQAKTEEFIAELTPEPLAIDFGNEKDPGIKDEDPDPNEDPNKGGGNPGAAKPEGEE